MDKWRQGANGGEQWQTQDIAGAITTPAFPPDVIKAASRPDSLTPGD